MQKYPHELVEIARELRRRQTVAEELLWSQLRSRRFCGLKFRRQHRIGRSVVDFCCRELNLVIELEGGVHDIPEQKAEDMVRFEELQSQGFKILRIKNEEVVENIGLVLKKVLKFRK